MASLRTKSAAIAQPLAPTGTICPIVDWNAPTPNQADTNNSVTGTAAGGEGVTISRLSTSTGAPINFRTTGSDELVRNDDASTNWTATGITPASASVPDYIRFDTRDNSINGAAPTYRLQFTFDQPVTNPVVSFSGTANREIVTSTSSSLVSSTLILDGSSGGSDGAGGTLPTPTATAIANGVRLTGAHGSDRFNVSLQISGTVTSFTVDLDPTTDTSAWTNTGGAPIWSQIDNAGVTLATADNCSPPVTDYGDAPDTYGTTRANGGASHTIVSGIHLGTAPDSESDAATPLDGTGDGAEDDGITLATLTEGDTSYTIPAGDIAATGTGTLHAWLDFDKSGTFEPGEHTSIGVTSDTPAGDLAWTGITAGAAGDTYARFRFTSDASITANTPGGAASDGEVEDYQVAIAQPVATNPNVVLVKRTTAINGDRTQNPNDNTVLNAVINDGDANSADDESRWPANYLLGEIDAGSVKPGDEIEYTVYFLNAGEGDAEDVRICDWIQPNQSVVTGRYGGNDIEFQLSEGAGSTTYNLTVADDPTVDRAQLSTVGTPPAGPTCNLPTAATTLTDSVLVIDLTGPTGDPSALTTTLPGSTTPAPTPDNSFGFFRFTTQVN